MSSSLPISYIPGLDDETEEIPLFSQEEWDAMMPKDIPAYKPIGPACDCGGWKTYGQNKNDAYYHADYCTIRNYYKWRG